MQNKSNTATVIYTPESQIRTLKKLFPAMWRDLKASRELAWRLFVRDISVRYRQSIFGILWAFLPPIATGLVFIILQSNKVVNFGDVDIPYPVFALVGTTLWQIFVDSLNIPLKTVLAAKPMLAKINFPREALIVSAFYDILFNLLIKSTVIAGVFVFFNIPITMGLLYGLFAILILILLGMAFGLLITPLGILYTDVSSGLMIITQFLFFVTPVVYPAPKTFPYSLVATINPISPVLDGARDLLTKGAIETWFPLLLVSIISVGIFLLSWIMYRLSLPIIIERMSA
jgi:lipopolysaccharide transport system permease protein